MYNHCLAPESHLLATPALLQSSACDKARRHQLPSVNCLTNNEDMLNRQFQVAAKHTAWHEKNLALLRRCACSAASDHSRSAFTAAVSLAKSYSSHSPPLHTLHTSGLYSYNGKHTNPLQGCHQAAQLSRNSIIMTGQRVWQPGRLCEADAVVGHQECGKQVACKRTRCVMKDSLHCERQHTL